MVQPKNPSKQPTVKDWLIDTMDRINKEHPIVATRHYVVEIAPPQDDYGYQYIPESRKVVSPYYDTKEEAQKFFNEHLPDKGNRLEVVTQHKRRTVTERWW